jgi:protein KRI1
MSKRKADTLTQGPLVNGNKKARVEDIANFLGDSDSDSEDGGAKIEESGFKINQDFAKRFEHNKKREEKQKCMWVSSIGSCGLTVVVEEKYEKAKKQVRGQYGDKYDEDSETSSTDEDEDDDGILATEALDDEISATLQAIRNKDPRVYDEKITFYAPIDKDGEPTAQTKKETPMYLADYHRQNLLAGNVGGDDEEDDVPRTFAQEQAELKDTIVKEMHAAGDAESEIETKASYIEHTSTTKGKGQTYRSGCKLCR